MTEELTATIGVDIQAPASAVWSALTDPDKIKLYLFGTHTVCDWHVGSSITYSGEWQGKAYEDKGVILESVPGERLVMTYWSSFSGVADVPENYQKITYRLEPIAGGTRLTVVQEGHRSPEAKEHSQQNWRVVLDGLKKILEG